jgi:hypothetical protein
MRHLTRQTDARYRSRDNTLVIGRHGRAVLDRSTDIVDVDVVAEDGGRVCVFLLDRRGGEADERCIGKPVAKIFAEAIGNFAGLLVDTRLETILAPMRLVCGGETGHALQAGHPPLSYPRNRKRQLSLQEQLGESRQTRKGETSKLDERLTPKPSSSRVSSQWKSRVSSPRKSTQAKLHPFTADERGKKREFRARQRESDPAPESRVSEIFRTPSRLPDPPPARVCSPRPPSGSTSGVKRAGHSAASPAPLRLAFEKYSSGRKRVCPG